MGDRSLGNAISMQNEPVEIVRCQNRTASTSQQDIETSAEENRRYLLLLETCQKTMRLLVGCILSSEIPDLFLALVRQTEQKSKASDHVPLILARNRLQTVLTVFSEDTDTSGTC